MKRTLMQANEANAANAEENIAKPKIRRAVVVPSNFFSPGSVLKVDVDRYEVRKIIGEGAYGIVCLAYDKVDETLVAIKRIELTPNELDRLYRELVIHRALTQIHDVDLNVVALKRFIAPDETTGLRVKHAYMVMEYFPWTVSNVATRTLPMSYNRKILFQLLRATSILHACGIFHRDMKPSNMLLDSTYRAVLCDFGLSRMKTDAYSDLVWSDYVATRFYRAPEVIGKLRGGYTSAMDMWSIGCIFAEIVTGKPLFMGDDATEQLQLIVNTIGLPTIKEISALTEKPMKAMLHKMRRTAAEAEAEVDSESERMESLAGFKDDPDALDLLKKMLTFDSDKRITATDALRHPFFGTCEFIDQVPSATMLQSISARVGETMAQISRENLDAMSADLLYVRVMTELKVCFSDEKRRGQNDDSGDSDSDSDSDTANNVTAIFSSHKPE